MDGSWLEESLSYEIPFKKRLFSISLLIAIQSIYNTVCVLCPFRFGSKYVVLDCPVEMAKEVVIGHVQGVQLSRKTHHYLISGLVRRRRMKFYLYNKALNKHIVTHTQLLRVYKYNIDRVYVCVYVHVRHHLINIEK